MSHARRWTIGSFALVVAGCLSLLPASVPMHWIESDAQTGQPAHCLLVLLPGAGDRDTEFFAQGFVNAVRTRHLSADVIAADATIGYYARGTVWERLAADVIRPAQSHGYSETWLAGISMGGLGTVLYPHEKPATVSGILLISPFLGDQKLIEEIEAAGGLEKWAAPAPVARIDSDNYQRELWRWLKAVTSGAEKGPEIYLGYGTTDRLGPAAKLLASRLPADHVYTAEGGHVWPTFTQLWNQFLEKSDFASRCK
jgi:pimeloyl-ACP methyl ester carboxylesterase